MKDALRKQAAAAAQRASKDAISAGPGRRARRLAARRRQQRVQVEVEEEEEEEEEGREGAFYRDEEAMRLEALLDGRPEGMPELGPALVG